MKNATHALKSEVGGVFFYFRLYGNGRVDMEHTKPGGEKARSYSPSLRDALARSAHCPGAIEAVRGCVAHCYGRAIADAIPDNARLVHLATEAALADMPADVKSMQRAIASGMAWRLQGSYGRAATRALDAGDCLLPSKAHADAYGNRVPSRYDLKAGTKGTRGLVVATHGEEYADACEALEGEAFTVADVETLEAA